MNSQLELVKEFHLKFKAPVLSYPKAEIKQRANLRYNLMKEEVDEYIKGVEKNDIENIAKELADILYTVYGTILEHGLQNIMNDIFEEVHNSQMSKDYSPDKMIKGEKYKKANLKQFFN